ncbi:hypothetical protein HYT59_01175 [Candidatus Woesebacteria bacterium]|nr:hypothetical protein [Candidatus Woesebacteria bacterium]
MIVLLTLLIRSLFHAFFAGSLYFFFRYSLGIKFGKGLFVIFMLIIGSIKELADFLMGWSGGVGTNGDLVRDIILTLSFIFILTGLKRFHDRFSKAQISFILLFAFIPLLILAFIYNQVFVEIKSVATYKHFVDVFSLSLGSLAGIYLIGKYLEI